MTVLSLHWRRCRRCSATLRSVSRCAQQLSLSDHRTHRAMSAFDPSNESSTQSAAAHATAAAAAGQPPPPASAQTAAADSSGPSHI